MPRPSSPSLGELVRVLNAATDKQVLHWGTTAEEDTFRTELGIGIVNISKTSSPSRYLLSLLDQEGILLDEYQPSGEGELLAIEALYKKARSQALNLEWKLKNLYDRIKSLAGET